MSLPAEIIAHAVVAAAKVFGDEPTLWARSRARGAQRAPMAAASALNYETGASLTVLCRALRLNAESLKVTRCRNREQFALAERAAAAATRKAMRETGWLPEAPVPPRRKLPNRKPLVRGVVNKATLAREAVAAALPGLFEAHPFGVPTQALMGATGLPYDHVVEACAWMGRKGLARWERFPGGNGKRLVPMEAALPEAPRPGPAPGYTTRQTDNMQRLLDTLRRMAGPSGRATASYSQIHYASGVAAGSLNFLVYELEKRGQITVVKSKESSVPNTYVFPDAPPAPEPEPEPPQPRMSIAEVMAKAIDALPALYAANPGGVSPGALGEAVGLTEPTDISRLAARLYAEHHGRWIRVPNSNRKMLFPWAEAKPEPPAPAPQPQPQPTAFTEEDFELPDADEGNPGRRSLLQLKTRMCHWPEGTPNPVQMYCAEPTERGEQYCAAHHRKMFIGGKPKKPRTAAQLAHDARLGEQVRQRHRERRAVH